MLGFKIQDTNTRSDCVVIASVTLILDESEPRCPGPVGGRAPGQLRSAPARAPPGLDLLRRLLLPGEGPPGELLQRPVAGHLATERHPALGADGQLGPVSAVLTHDVTLGALPDLPIVSSEG